MADNELMAKLAKQRQKAQTDEEVVGGPLPDVIQHAQSERTTDPAPAADSFRSWQQPTASIANQLTPSHLLDDGVHTPSFTPVTFQRPTVGIASHRPASASSHSQASPGVSSKTSSEAGDLSGVDQLELTINSLLNAHISQISPSKASDVQLQQQQQRIGRTQHHRQLPAPPAMDPAQDELMKKLQRQALMADGETLEPHFVKVKHVESELALTRKQTKHCQAMFDKFDVNGDGFIDFDELKLMMERLGNAQTHLALKQMIAEVDDDNDNKISLKEFMQLYRKVAAGELSADSSWLLFADISSIDVTKEGVGGAKNFFEAKIEQLNHGSAFEAEIRHEQEERRRLEEEKAARRAAFLGIKQQFH